MCKRVKSQKMILGKDQFVNDAIRVHGNKYDYSKVEYKNNHTKVCIICLEHGEFWQKPCGHLFGQGCPKCAGRSLTLEDFIKKAREIHGDKYDYSESVYVQSDKKIEIKCNNCGHKFWQKPWSHLQNHGCPNCCSSKGEEFITNLLQENNIPFIYQKKFPEWLGLQSLDFYLPEHNIAIEYQGEQHFNSSKSFGSNPEEFEKITRERDLRKKQLCEDNGITVLYYADDTVKIPEDFNLYEVIRNKDELLNKIVAI